MDLDLTSSTVIIKLVIEANHPQNLHWILPTLMIKTTNDLKRTFGNYSSDP